MASDESVEGEFAGEERFVQAENVGPNIHSILEMAPIIETPEEQVQEVLNRMEQGLCCTCNSELGEKTMVVVTEKGVAMAFCTGVCMTDMQVIGFIEELHDDIVDRIKFRAQTSEGDHD